MKRYTKTAFSLVELLIILIILSVIAAMVIPEFQNNSAQAKEAAAKANLKMPREAIERYTVEHNGIAPGYFGNILLPEGFFAMNQLVYCSTLDGDVRGTPKVPTGECKYGPYLGGSNVINPFNNEFKWVFVNDFSTIPTGTNGWLYNPATKEIRIDWPGTDSKSIRYFDY